MAKDHYLGYICAVTILVAAILNNTIHLRKFEMPRKVDISFMPKSFGQWTSVEEVPMSNDLHASLKSADGYERTYRSKAGTTVKLLLLNATAYGDYHSPQACFPAQGWNIGHVSTHVLEGQTINEMVAQRTGVNLDVSWWFMAYQKDQLKSVKQSRLETLLSKMMQRPEGTSLLVRIISTSDGQVDPRSDEFAHDVMPELYSLLQHHSHEQS